MPLLPSLALALLPAPQEPLFSFVQTSDSQPVTTQDQQAFEEVMDEIADSGSPGALLRERVAFVLFAGDLVDSPSTTRYQTWVDTIDARLTDNGIALLAVPGNHDRTSSGSFALYEDFVADSSPWDVGSAAFTGQNGIAVDTGWAGLRFIGLNNSNGADNQVSNADRADVQARVNAAVADDENVFVIVHHPHNANGRTPLADVLETPGVVGYLRGHTGSPHALHGLAGIDNDDVWDVDTNNIFEDGALVYFEAFTNELHAFVLQLQNNPTSLGTRIVIPLVHPLHAADPGPTPGTVRLGPVADAYVQSAQPSTNFGASSELRVRNGGSSGTWRSYLRFDLSAVTAPILSARLRLFCTNPSSDGGALHSVAGAWSEGSITSNNAPAPSQPPLLPAPAVSDDTWIERDVTGAILAGVRNFELVSANDNGAIYSSREGAQPPELVLQLGTPPPPLAVDRIVPASVDVFVPGTQEGVRIEGANFGAGATVELDGVPLLEGAFTLVDDGTITVDLPPAGVGAHTLTVRRGAQSDSATFQAVLPPGPRLQIGTGDALNSIDSDGPVPLLLSGPAGTPQLVVMSLTLTPSTAPFVNLLIGGNFSDLVLVSTQLVPASGFVATSLTLSTSTTLTVHAQSVSRGSAPFPASNLQTFRLTP